jgi:hypothetical protein
MMILGYGLLRGRGRIRTDCSCYISQVIDPLILKDSPYRFQATASGGVRYAACSIRV